MSKRLLALSAATLVVGLVLAGSLVWHPAAATAHPLPVPHAGPENRVEVRVTEAGFEPAAVRVAGGKPVTLMVTRVSDKSCATELVIPGIVERLALPLDVSVSVTFLPPTSGTLRYGCGVGMMVSAVLLVD